MRVVPSCHRIILLYLVNIRLNERMCTSKSLHTHPFHLVRSSPWPAIISVALGALALSAAATFSALPYSRIETGFFILVVIITLWFRDVACEGGYLGDHRVEVVRGIVFGIALFIVTELLVFFAIFWSYFHSALSPTVELGRAWPPIAIDAVDAYALPFLNTALLLGSGATVTLSHHSLVAGLRPAFLLRITLTLLLSFIFTGVQGMEY
jgi:cytochrome c oxidase subunit 3